MSLAWEFRDTHGDTAAFHSEDPPARRVATFHTADVPTLVLGSAQPTERVHRRVADALGIDVVRRRSGGGGVLLLPGEFLWLDVVVPHGDPLWSDDVGRAMLWVGDAWTTALSALGVHGEVHRGGLVSSTWSRDVCFAGVGTGEVMAGASKLVGISQRRTRAWARFQTMVHLHWRPELVAALVSPPAPSAADLATVATAAPCAPVELRDALVAALSALA